MTLIEETKQKKEYKLLVKIIKGYLPRLISFIILLAIYSYIWSKYDFERTLMVMLISIIIVLGSKK